MSTLYQSEPTCCIIDSYREQIMAAEAAEQRITQALQRELERVDKECMRPMQVRLMSLLSFYKEGRTLGAWSHTCGYHIHLYYVPGVLKKNQHHAIFPHVGACFPLLC